MRRSPAGLVIAPFNLLGLALPGVYLLALALASVAVAAKKRSICGLLAGLASGVMHMSWSAGLFRQMLKGRRR